MDNRALDQWVITPKSRYCYGVSVKKQEGDIKDSKNILSAGKETVKIEYKKGGLRPKLILDMGEASPGGYPVFTVKSKKGTPVLRLSYSDYYPHIDNNEYDLTGDFSRGDCKYLGVELPVLPANPNRFELYTINRTGKFIYPLIQGQQRFVLITLDTEDSAVELESFYIYYTSDLSPYNGYFLSDNENLNRIWYASAYTVQLASIDNASSWEVVEGFLALRALTKGNRAGIYQKGLDWKDYTFEFKAQISINPHVASGIGWMVRAADRDNGYLFRLDLDGLMSFYKRANGVNIPMAEALHLDFRIVDNTEYVIRTEVSGNQITIFIDGREICQLEDETYQSGTIGFCQTVEKWAIVSSLKVYDKTDLLFADCFENGLGDYVFTKAQPYLSDGAKRDRLPWSGDLYWAGRNAYSAFSDFCYMPGTIDMMMRHQTPEGYLWATCYPEDKSIPARFDYGYYESDIFAAWLPIVLGDYLLYTGDISCARRNYDAVKRVLDYIYEYVDGDGIFFQRYETSKGLWDHNLNDFGKYAYNNLIMYFAFLKSAFIAEKLQDTEKKEEYLKKAEILKKAIMTHFWDEEMNCFKVTVNRRELCPLANSLALDIGFVSDGHGRKLADTMLNWLKTNNVHGKIVILFLNGLMTYGLHEEKVLKMLLGKAGNTEIEEAGGVSWVYNINDDNSPATTTECMHYPVHTGPAGHAWGDLSHPDTGVAHIITGCILGVKPLDIGYKKFIFEPKFFDLKNMCGEVPTPFGAISVSYSLENGQKKIKISYPEAIEMVTSCEDIEIETIRGKKDGISHQMDLGQRELQRA